jgi:DNA helicase-2/ATP-dependent DNA helicase PcrA
MGNGKWEIGSRQDATLPLPTSYFPLPSSNPLPTSYFPLPTENPLPTSYFPLPSSIRGGSGLSLCLAAVLEASGIAEYHRSRDDISGAQRLSNLQELANAASAYPGTREGLLEFLEHIELDRAVEDDPAKGSTDVVTLITLHNTKGLEFPKVIITGVERGIFPRADKKDDDLEEERRLFYVGATRAMDELYLCSCAWRRVFGRLSPMEPSVFLQEIDPRYIRMIGDVPRGFKASSYDDEHPLEGPRPGPGIPARQVSSDGRWAVGDRLFHDDRGYGAVAAIEEGEDGPVIKARFDSGFEARFLSGSKSFMKISED